MDVKETITAGYAGGTERVVVELLKRDYKTIGSGKYGIMSERVNGHGAE